MNALSTIQDNLRTQVQQLTKDLRRRLFGVNNERLDLLVDSFYKLEPPQRNAVIAGGIAALVLMVATFLILYFAQVASLNRELNKRFDALYEMRELKHEYQVEDRRFAKVIESITSDTASARIKPYFEKVANEQGVQIDGLNETKVPLAADNPMSDKLQEVKIDMNLSNISIPRLLNFVVEVEKGSGSIRIQDMQIRARYGTKLFFDVKLKGHGYIPSN